MANGFIHPEFIVETEWLANHLNDSDVRVLDCTTHLMPPKNGGHTMSFPVVLITRKGTFPARVLQTSTMIFPIKTIDYISCCHRRNFLPTQSENSA